MISRSRFIAFWASISLVTFVFGGEPEMHFPADRPLDLEHIKLDVRVDLKKKTLDGQAAVDLTALRDVSSVRLDAVDFKVNGVQIQDSKNEKWSDVKYENDGKHISFSLPETLHSGEKLRVHVNYSVNDPPSGLSFFAPDQDDPEAPYVMWSQGESITNRYWVPCFDHPNEKQTTEIVCTVDKPNKVISNGKLVDHQDTPDGTRTFHWVQDKPHAAYLMTLVVGDFFTKTVQWRGRPVSFHVREKFKGEIDNSFSHTTAMLDFFSDQIGVEYAWDKYDQVCCYNFGGGMENTSATTLTESTLHDDRAQLDESSDGLVSHELAHQWWGDMLTCKDWAHIWLNEGFASYFEALWDEHAEGPDEFAYNMFRKAQGAIDGGKEKPIVYRKYEDPDEQFDSRAYPKGAWVLHMMRRQIGDELFWKVLKTYATRFKYQCVETSDLRKVVEEVTGRAFEPFFYEWTERPGCPVVQIDYKWIESDKQASIKVKQTQKEEAFSFPLALEFCGEGGAAPYRLSKDITEKEQSFLIPMANRPEMVRIDPDNAVLMEVTLELPRDIWEATFKSDPNPVARIRAARYFGKSKSKQDKALLAERLPLEKFWGVQKEIADALADDGSEMARDALLAAIKIENPKARAAVVTALGKFSEEQPVEEALLAIVKKGDPSYRVEANAIEAYAEVYGDDPSELLKSVMDRDSDNEIIRRSALRALGKHGKIESLDFIMEYMGPKKPRECRGAAVEAIADLIEREEPGKEVEKKAVEAITKCLKKTNRRLQIGAMMALEKLGSKAKSALPEIDRLGKTGGPRARSMATRVAKKIREGGGAGGADLKDLKDRLAKVEGENRRLKDRIQKLEPRGDEDEGGDED